MKIPIGKVKISHNQAKIKEQFLKTKELQIALWQLRKTGKPQPIKISTVEIPTEGDQQVSLGKVKFEATGILRQSNDGKIVFNGILEQGKNMEVYTFPKGSRKPQILEDLTTLGREAAPFTLFRTIINGRQAIKVEF